jgi:hypothetical protein
LHTCPFDFSRTFFSIGAIMDPDIRPFPEATDVADSTSAMAPDADHLGDPRSQGRSDVEARGDASNDSESTTSAASADRFAHIPGWGTDLDHAMRPAYPMERTPPRLPHRHSDHIEQQAETVEILVSSERPGITPLFGTPQPPSGLSGQVRRTAFKFSESDLRHWLLLLVADRVNMVEGLGSDLLKGRVPNVFAEMGGKAALRHDRENTIRKIAVASAVGVGLLLMMKGRSRRASRRAAARQWQND